MDEVHNMVDSDQPSTRLSPEQCGNKKEQRPPNTVEVLSSMQNNYNNMFVNANTPTPTDQPQTMPQNIYPQGIMDTTPIATPQQNGVQNAQSSGGGGLGSMLGNIGNLMPLLQTMMGNKGDGGGMDLSALEPLLKGGAGGAGLGSLLGGMGGAGGLGALLGGMGGAGGLGGLLGGIGGGAANNSQNTNGGGMNPMMSQLITLLSQLMKGKGKNLVKKQSSSSEKSINEMVRTNDYKLK